MLAGGTRRWIPLVALALGAASVLVLLGTDRLRQRDAAADRAQLAAVTQIEADVAVAHLWLEEHVTGDRVDLGDVRARLASARRLAAGLRGAAPALRHQAEVLDGWIRDLETISDQRLEGFRQGLQVGIGSDFDARYDAVFAEVLAQTEVLEEALAARLAESDRRSRLVLRAIVAAWSLLVAAAVIASWRYERQRRSAEAELERSRAQLIRSQRLDAMGRLASGLAHDLNNYLAAIRGHCELVLRKRPEGDAIGRKMERVIAVVARASALIERLQAFNREQPLRPRAVGLDRLVEATVAMLRPSLGEDVILAIDAAPGLWPVAADPAQLEQVLVNLVVNARDAMPTGGEIAIALANRPGGDGATAGPAADAVALSVADTGSGIEPAIRERIFEPFQTTRETAGHSGLGLAIVYGIVSRHGGRIEVESEPGAGTRFEILLPRAAPGIDGDGDLETDGDGETGGGDEALGGAERILLVDDHAEFRGATSALLSSLGYRVEAVADGEAAIAACAAAENAFAPPFDAVLTDVVMPGLGGRELAERIRARWPETAIVFLSGHSSQVLGRYGIGEEEARIAKAEAGGKGLARRIRQVLDGRSPPAT